MAHRPGGGTPANGTLTAWTASSDGPSGEYFFRRQTAPSFREMAAQADSSLFKNINQQPKPCPQKLVYTAPYHPVSPPPSSPTLSTSQLVTIETFSPALCFSAHTNNYFYFYMMFLLLTFCRNVLHRLIVTHV